ANTSATTIATTTIHRRSRTKRCYSWRVGQVGQVGTQRFPHRPHLPHLPNMDALIIAIDGPSGAGKGTVARAVARELGYKHIDSGAMYRAVGWKALRDGVPLDNEAEVAALAERATIEVAT